MKRGFHSTILAIAASSLMSVTGTMAAENPVSFDMHHDSIPNFALNPTIQSTQNGNWSSASTWIPARVPQSGDIVLIDHNVSYDSLTGNATVIGIEATGALRFKTNQNTTLKVGTLLVMPNGTLEVGTSSAPIAGNVTAEIIIKDQPIDLTNNGVGVYDPEQYGTGILVVDGTWTMHGATKSSTFVRLTEEPLVGSTTLELSVSGGGWNIGDRLILPDTRHLNSGKLKDNKYIPEWEELTVASMSGNGKTLTLTDPLQFNHFGARDGDDHLDFLPHIGNLTRNIIIRSENPNGTRGHTQVHHKANIDIRYAAFKELGRTKNEHIDNTTFDSSGNVTHVGTNQIARYPIHTHHLRGPLPTPSNGHQFTLIGNAVDGGTTAHNQKWGITIHGSHYGLIRENIVYNMAGSGIAFEDGSESYNVLEENFVMRIIGTGTRPDASCNAVKIDCGMEGTGYWFRGPNNYVRNNVTTSTHNQFGYNIFIKFMGERNIPAYKGADPNHGGSESQTVHMSAMPLLEFSGNEAYGTSQGGIEYWFLGLTGADADGLKDVDRSYISDFVAWHTATGLSGYPSHRLTFDHTVIRGDKNTVSSQPSSGFIFSDYLQKDFVIQNADIQGVRTGIDAPLVIEPLGTAQSGVVTIKDSIIRAYYGITVLQPWHNNNATLMNPREIHIRNVKFEGLNVPPIGSNFPPYPGIKMDPTIKKTNLIVSTKVFVYDYNQIPGEDFQVFSPEQAPSFLTTQSTFKEGTGAPILIGAPQAGQTNTQNMAQYGISMGGEITPCLDSTSYPEMRGFVCNGSSTMPPQDTIPPTMIAGFTVM